MVGAVFRDQPDWGPGTGPQRKTHVGISTFIVVHADSKRKAREEWHGLSTAEFFDMQNFEQKRISVQKMDIF